MGCRVGMSTDPQERIDHWKKEEGHTHSRILHEYLTYSEATAKEKDEAKERGCVYYPGGVDNGLRNWSVYLVWGGNTS